MTWQVYIEKHDRKRLKAQALVDSGSSISVVTQHLVRQFNLKKHWPSLVYKTALWDEVAMSQPLWLQQQTSKAKSTTLRQPLCQRCPQIHQTSHLSRSDIQCAQLNWHHTGIWHSGCHHKLWRQLGSPGQPIAISTRHHWQVHPKPRTSGPQVSLPDVFSSRLWQTPTSILGVGGNGTPSNTERVHCWRTGSSSPLGSASLVHIRWTLSSSTTKEVGNFQLGESRSHVVQRFITTERSLLARKKWQDAVQEYLTLQHAEPVSPQDINKPHIAVYYLPMHAVYKPSSTTTKLWVVYDASAKT